MVALVMPVQRETMVIFDDVRYLLGDAVSMRSFAENLAESAGRYSGKSLLILSDRRVSAGHLMEVVSAAFGLLVGVLATVMYGSLRVRLDRTVVELEAAASQIIGFLSAMKERELEK